jgi:peptide/nickel transport system substrate-binding protein
MTRMSVFTTAGLIFSLLAVPNAHAETSLRLGFTALPPAKGNPYNTTATTAYTFFTAIFDPLTQIDDKGVVHPWLAAEWMPLNETTWHFKLRPNVTFSNGEPLNAAAVKTTFDFLLSPAAVAQTVARDIEFISAARVIDDLTVEITTKTPNILLPRYLAGINIVAPKHFATLGIEGFAQDPVGTGPFKVETWGAERVVLEAFTSSWRAPKVDRLEILALPDATSRIQALETKRVDVATNISTDEKPRLEAEGYRFHSRNPTRVMVVAFEANREGSPFRDVRVRQAMNYAVDRQAIVDKLLSGLTRIASQPAAPTAVGYAPELKPYAYDPAKAKALLAEAGYPNGFSFMMEVPSGQLANDAAVAQQVAVDLANVGVKVEIREINFGQVVRNMTQGNWKGLAMYTDFATAPALDFGRSITRHSCGWATPWFCDRSIEPVIAEAERTFDEARRTALTRQISTHYRDVASSLFLYPGVSLDGLSPRVRTWQPWNDNFMYHLADVSDGE